MTVQKEMTVNHMKKKRTVPGEAREKSKEFAKIKKVILASLEPGPLAIPQIAEKTELPTAVVTYYLMSLRKYGDIEETEEIDENDYYLYRLKGGR